MLKRYWFSFEKFDQPTPLNLGARVQLSQKKKQ